MNNIIGSNTNMMDSNNLSTPPAITSSSGGFPPPPPMQVMSPNLGFNPTPASMLSQHHQYQQPYIMNSSSNSHIILPFGPSPSNVTGQSQQSFPSLISPFPSIHTSIPPTHFLSGNAPSQSQPLTSPTLDKRRRNPSAKRSFEDEDEEDIHNSIEIDDSEQDEQSKQKYVDPKQVTNIKDNGAKGCNCKKTGCLKRYCECFQNNKRCTIKCRCQGCKNYDGCSDLHRVLEKQTKSGATTNSSTNQRKTQKRKLNNSQTAPASSNTSTRPPIGSPSILGGGIVMAHGSVSQFNPMPFTNPQIAANLHQNPLSCTYGEEKIVELCKKLILAAVQQEQVFKDGWSNSSTTNPPKTPNKGVRKEGSQPVDNFLLCDEDDMHQSSTQQSSSSNRKLYPKGFENALGISLNERVTQEFKQFLSSGVQSLKVQQSNDAHNILNNSMQYQ